MSEVESKDELELVWGCGLMNEILTKIITDGKMECLSIRLDDERYVESFRHPNNRTTFVFYCKQPDGKTTMTTVTLSDEAFYAVKVLYQMGLEIHPHERTK